MQTVKKREQRCHQKKIDFEAGSTPSTRRAKMKKINNGKCGRCYRATRTLMLGVASWEYNRTDILEKFGCLLSIYDPGILVLEFIKEA